MSISFHGTQESVLTFEAGSVTAGNMVGMSANNKVADASAGTLPVGKAIHVRGDIAAVQVKGYMELPYSGTAPSLGWGIIVADGDGGVKSATTGLTVLIVEVDSTNETLGMYL